MKIDWGSLGMGLAIIAVILGCGYLFWSVNWGEPRELAQHGRDAVGLVRSVKSHNMRAGTRYFTQYWHMVEYDGHTKMFILREPFPIGSELTVRYLPDAPDKAKLAIELQEPVETHGLGHHLSRVRDTVGGAIGLLAIAGFLYFGGTLVVGAFRG
jgi:hypothetical protein